MTRSPMIVAIAMGLVVGAGVAWYLSIRGDSARGTVQGDAPTGSAQGEAPSGTVQGDARVGSVQGAAPSGSVQGEAPSGTVQGDARVGSVQGAAPSGSVQGDAPLGSVQGEAPLGSVQGAAPLGSMAPALPEVTQRGGAAGAGWRHSRLWDDGNAEFSAYEVTWRRYGQLYSGRALLILVKEPWAPDLNVKADTPRLDGFDVLKLNHVRDVPTGIYTYHQMGSVYFRRDTGALVKIATTSSEACGVSTALMVDGRLQTHSYFDGQGDRTQIYPATAVPHDALPAMLRDYVRGEVPETIEVFPMLLMGRFNQLAPSTYGVERRTAVSVRVPAGVFSAVEIVLRRDDDELAFAFENEPPHRLLRYQRSDGTEYRLAKSERIPYWTLHDPGDEAWIPEHLRSAEGQLTP